MTVSVTTSEETYTGDGVTTIFPTVFVFNIAADIEVIERDLATGAETTQVNPTNYSVTGGGGTGGIPAAGDVVAVVAPPNTVSWTLNRIVAEVQETSLPEAGPFPSKSVEGMDDRQIMMIQQQTTEQNRSLKYPVTDPLVGTELPNSVERADKYLAFGPNGEVVTIAGTTGFSSGTESNPGVAPLGDSDTGLYWPAPNTMAITFGGTEGWRGTVDSILVTPGTETVPGLATLGDTDTGLFWPAANTAAVTLGGTEAWRATENGFLIPSQPAFYAMLSANQNSVTGDGTVVTVVFDTERFDRKSNYNDGTGVFTAPVAGIYQFSTSIRWANNGTATRFDVHLITDTRSYDMSVLGDGAGFSNQGMTGGSAILVNMGLNETARIDVAASGGALDETLFGVGGDVTWFCGNLVA